MIDQLVEALKQVWKDVGLNLKGIDQHQQPQHQHLQQQQQHIAIRQHA
jgi:hypothetical protein